MSALIIRSLPDILHRRLRIEAENHHRSMNREVIAILEKEFSATSPVGLPTPVKGKKSVSPEWVVQTIRKARDAQK